MGDDTARRLGKTTTYDKDDDDEDVRRFVTTTNASIAARARVAQTRLGRRARRREKVRSWVGD